MSASSTPTTLPLCEFLDGQSLVSIAVHVELHAHWLHILDGAAHTLVTWEYSGLRCDAMHDGDVLHVTHGSGPALLVVRDVELGRRMRAATSSVAALPGGRHKLPFALALLAVILALGGLVYHYAPLLAHVVATRIPLEQERALGAQLEPMLELTGCKSEGAQAALRELSRRLHPEAARAFDVRVMRTPMPNAFALPGGMIVVTDELLRTADTPDELAGVLAHEIEHVVQRHVLAGFLRGVMLSGLWALTVGDYSGLMLIDPSTAYQIKNLEFSRADEEAADRAAVLRLHRAGMSHRGLIRFFERIEKLSDDTPAWLSTHPSTSSRIAWLKATPDLPGATPALDDAGFAALRLACDAPKPGHGPGSSGKPGP